MGLVQYKDVILPVYEILQPSYLQNGISYTGKITFLYGIKGQVIKQLNWIKVWGASVNALHCIDLLLKFVADVTTVPKTLILQIIIFHTWDADYRIINWGYI